MYNEELHQKTKELYKKLTQFMVHVIVYFLINFAIIAYVFQNLSQRWGLFFIAMVWAIVLIYHALLVSGVDFLKRNKRIKSFI